MKQQILFVDTDPAIKVKFESVLISKKNYPKFTVTAKPAVYELLVRTSEKQPWVHRAEWAEVSKYHVFVEYLDEYLRAPKVFYKVVWLRDLGFQVPLEPDEKPS